MIFDEKKNLSLYSQLIPNLELVISVLGKVEAERIEPGKYNIEGGDIFYLCFEYTTRPADLCGGEIHKKYIDLHYITEGVETVGLVDVDQAEIPSFDEEKDYGAATGTFQEFLLPAGSFAIIFPHEAHKTGICAGTNPEKVKKLVFKIPALTA